MEIENKLAEIGLVGAQSSVKVDLSGITVTEKTIHSDGQAIRINIVKPANSKGILPVFMFFHGGGWVLGYFPIMSVLCATLVVQSGAAAVLVNYAPSRQKHITR